MIKTIGILILLSAKFSKKVDRYMSKTFRQVEDHYV